MDNEKKIQKKLKCEYHNNLKTGEWITYYMKNGNIKYYF